MIKRFLNAWKRIFPSQSGPQRRAVSDRENFVLHLIGCLLKKANQLFDQGAADEALILCERAISLTEQVLASENHTVRSIAVSQARHAASKRSNALKQLKRFTGTVIDQERGFTCMMACHPPLSRS